MFNFLKRYRQSKLVKQASSFILNELADTALRVVNEAAQKGEVKSELHKEILKFESTAFMFWLFQKTNIFPREEHKLILDALHEQYFEKLKQHGYDSRMRQAVCNDLNSRYKAYNEEAEGAFDLTRCGLKFSIFVSERAKIDRNTNDLLIPAHLSMKISPKFEEWSKTTSC